MMKDKLADSVGKRFRLHPAPVIEDERGRRELDVTLIAERLEGEGFRLSGVASPYSFVLGFDHVIERISNPVAQPMVHGEAILKLKTQVVFGPGGVRFELLDRLFTRPERLRPGARRVRRSPRRRRGAAAAGVALPKGVIAIPLAGTNNKTAEVIAFMVLAVLLIAALSATSA